MSIWRRLSRQSLRLLLKLLVRIRQIPVTLQHQGGRSPERLIYVLPYRSEIDLLILQRYCHQRQQPDPLGIDTINGQPYGRYLFLKEGSERLSTTAQCDRPSAQALQQQLTLLRSQAGLDCQLVLVLMIWGRTPGYGRVNANKAAGRWLVALRRFFRVVLWGRDLFIDLATPISLRQLSQRLESDPQIIKKLARLARWHWLRRYFMVTGPVLPKRSRLLHHCLQTSTLQAAMVHEACSKQKEMALVERQGLFMLDEMAAHFSYGFIQYADRLFSWLWNRLYQGIVVNNVEPVRQLALAGKEIVYLPCHRSHMDYLLLSYVLYQQGLMLPHIAAGINLNFWPVGALFRRTGAFFIRRSFKGNKLYSMVLQSYLTTLFAQGCSVEYFIEGGRSRTGRLLAPKTGLLSMTLQALISGTPRPVVLVPVYIGYEHLLEARTYAQELAGIVKQPESFWKLLKSLQALRHLGRCTVNFGTPIPLSSDLRRQFLDGKQSEAVGNPPRLNGVQALVNPLAQKIMRAINSAVAVNAVNLCVTVLLIADKKSLPRSLLVHYLTSYLDLLRQAPYSSGCTLPEESAERLIDQAVKLGKVQLLNVDQPEPQALIPQQLAAELSYYRNNIQHLLVLPSLIANLVLNQPGISTAAITQRIAVVYPVLQADLFIDYSHPSLAKRVSTTTQVLSRQQLIRFQGEGYRSAPSTLALLQHLAANTQELLQRYLLIVKCLLLDPQWSRSALEARIARVTKAISGPSSIRTWGFFDKGSTVIATLQTQGAALLAPLENLLPPAQVAFIEDSLQQQEEETRS